MFDLDAAWECSRKVTLRSEPFGALAYHYHTRRLVFLRSAGLVDLVTALSRYPTAANAIDAVIDPADTASRDRYIEALASLAESGVIEAVQCRVAADPCTAIESVG